MSKATHESSNISLKRSDGKAHDLTALTKQVQILGLDLPQTPIVQDGAAPPNPAEHDHAHSISIKRSDGVAHAINSRMSGKSSIAADSPIAPALPSLLVAQPSYHPATIRIVHMSDTHDFLHRSSKFNSAFLPEGDILIHSGNFSNDGLEVEFAQFDDWLSAVSTQYKYRVVVVGNRDVKQVGNNWDEIRSRLPHATHVLCHNSAEILGIRIYGCPWHWGHKYNYALRTGAPEFNRFAEIPEDLDILVTHGPAYGRLDSIFTIDAAKELRCGSNDLAAAIYRARPSVHLHGHINDSRGFIPALGHNPFVVNSCLCDKDARVLYSAPHVIVANLLLSSTTGGRSVWSFELGPLV